MGHDKYITKQDQALSVGLFDVKSYLGLKHRLFLLQNRDINLYHEEI